MNRSSQQGKMLIIVIGIVVVILLGIGAYLWWSNQQPMTTVTLPNGKTATYPDTENNKKIGFKSAEKGNEDGTYVTMTHTGYATFMSSVDPAMLNDLCGPDAESTAQKNDIVGLFRTSDKTITLPPEATCFNLLTSSNNTDSILREKASAADNAISSDVGNFIKDVTIK